MSDVLMEWIDLNVGDLEAMGFKIDVSRTSADYGIATSSVGLFADKVLIEITCWEGKRFDFDVLDLSNDSYAPTDQGVILTSEYAVNEYFKKIYSAHIAPFMI